MTQTADSLPAAPGAEAADDVSPVFAARALGAIVLLAAALLGKQMVCARIATTDATGYYLPMARAWAEGSAEKAQNPVIPPLYPMVLGACSGALARADDPYELAGRFASAAAALVLVWTVYALGRQMGSRRAGLVAAGLTAANRAVIRIGVAVGPDMIYAALLAGMALMLLKHRSRPRITLAAGAGAAAALAALLRGEGLVLTGAAAVALAVTPIRPGRRWITERLLPLAVMLAVTAAIWSPRLAYMHRKTGWAVLDARLLFLVSPETAVQSLGDETWLLPRQIPAARPVPRPPAPLAQRLGQAAESLLDVIGYAGWALILYWLIAGRRLLPGRGGHLVLLAVLTVQLGVLGLITLGKRYVTIVTGPAQVWAGLGAAALVRHLRRRTTDPQAVATIERRALAAFAGVLAVLSAVSLFSTNHGVRHAELRDLGRLARRRFGPGRVILAQGPQLPYYAEGYQALAPDPRYSPHVDKQALCSLCREHAIALIELRTRRPFSPWLLEQVRSRRLGPGALVAERQAGKYTVYLIDARVLFGAASSATQGAGSP